MPRAVLGRIRRYTPYTLSPRAICIVYVVPSYTIPRIRYPVYVKYAIANLFITTFLFVSKLVGTSYPVLHVIFLWPKASADTNLLNYRSIFATLRRFGLIMRTKWCKQGKSVYNAFKQKIENVRVYRDIYEIKY